MSRSTTTSACNWSHVRSSSCWLALRAAATAALIAVHAVASANGSNDSNVLHIPVCLSTHRRTLRSRRIRSWRDNPSSPLRLRARSWHSRSNCSGVNDAAALTNDCSCSANRSLPSSSSWRAALASASTWPAVTVPSANASPTPGIRSHTVPRSAAASASRWARRPPPASTVAGVRRPPVGGQPGRPSGDPRIDRVEPATQPQRPTHQPVQPVTVLLVRLGDEQLDERIQHRPVIRQITLHIPPRTHVPIVTEGV